VTVRHLLEIDDLSPAELEAVLRRAAEPPPVVPPLAGRTIGLYFEKPSLRTRHSCEVAVVQLGGHPVVDGAQSRVIVQVHNRLHSFRGLLAWRIDEAAR
jgi:ornithine carbamoyltransferase